MNSAQKQYQPFMMAEERAARSVFGKLNHRVMPRATKHFRWLAKLVGWYGSCSSWAGRRRSVHFGNLVLQRSASWLGSSTPLLWVIYVRSLAQ